MRTLQLHIHQKPMQKALKALFKELHDQAKTTLVSADHLMVETGIDPIDPIDYTDIHALLVTDFDDAVTLLVLEDATASVIDSDLIAQVIPIIPPKHYDVEDFILTVLKRFPEAAQRIKKNLSTTLGVELIETALALADANMNASIAAKNLYMHRNTLLYRLEKIIEKTAINIKSFKGLSIFTQLYRH